MYSRQWRVLRLAAFAGAATASTATAALCERRRGPSISGPLRSTSVVIASSPSGGPFSAPETPPAKVPLRDFTEAELEKCNGVDGAPLYVCVNGDIYDVEERRDMYYPPGGENYSFIVAKEAAVALALMAVSEKWIPKGKSLHNLTEEEADSLRSWIAFFKKRYPLVGRLVKDGKHLKDPKFG